MLLNNLPKKNLVAVITVRKGSERVKNKNFKLFAGKNILEHKIIVLKKIKELDDIIINTDSERAIKIAKKYNVSFFRREAYFASSSCSNSEFWSNIAKNTNSHYIMFTHCTNPMVKEKTYREFIKIFKKNKNKYDSFNTVSDVKEFLFKKNKPLNFNPVKTPNSQNLPEIEKLNFAINILSTYQMYKTKTLIGKKPFFYKLDQVEGYDINTPLEFSFAEHLFKNR
jgi:N-acylneuraminate cytidylyltransferase